MSKTNLNRAVKIHVLESIDLETYDIDSSAMSNKEKALEVIEIAKSEVPHEFKRRSQMGALSWYFSALPSICTVHFENYKILEWAKENGRIFKNEDEKDQFIESWFDRCATALLNISVMDFKEKQGEL